MGLLTGEAKPTHEADSLKQALRTASDTEKVRILHHLTRAYVNNDPEKAETYGQQALRSAEKASDQEGISRALCDLGLVYDHAGNYDEAISNYQKALRIYQARNNEMAAAMVLNNIGAIHFSRAGYEKAIQYWEEALAIKKEKGSAKDVAEGLTNLAAALTRLKEYNRAKKAYEEALTTFRNIGDTTNMATCYNNIGILLNKSGQEVAALPYFQKAQKIHQELNNEKGLVTTHMNIGFGLVEKKNYTDAISNFKRSLSLAEKLNWKPALKQVHANLSETYALAGDYENAYRSLHSYMAIKDSMLNARSSEQIAALEAKYENEKKKKVIKQRTLELERSRKNVLMLSAGLSFVILFGLFFLLSYRQRKKAKEKLEAAKSRFFSNIVHEFRTPMTLIRGPVEEVVKKTTDEDIRKKLQISLRNYDQLMVLTDQLLDISRLESGKMRVEQYYGDVVPLFREVAEDIERIAVQKRIELSCTSDESIETVFDADKFRKIFYNLFSNAVKFTLEGGRIEAQLAEIRNEEQNKQVRFTISDTGIGMSPQQQKMIFDRFYQADDSTTRNYEGTGIGLSLVKELVDLLDGTVEVQSRKGEGTTFTIDLPIENMEAYQEEGKIAWKNHEGKDHDGQGLHVLIVEDHHDLRHYLHSILSSCAYTVSLASNGEEGMAIAREKLPDVVITDIMMPRMDGNELCHAIKSDPLTAHTPVIMLTAKTDMQSRMKGIEQGAEIYLSKPFSTSELLLRIANLIETRKQLQDHYMRQLQGKEQSENQEEEHHDPFVHNVITVIKEHLDDEQFGVEALAAEMGMSRPQLYRKIKAVTGDTVTRLIRIIRLRKAWKMLEEDQGNVTEIAYSVGFSSQSYFTRCFTEEFGTTPKAVKNEGNNSS